MKKCLKISFALSLLFAFPLLMFWGQPIAEGVQEGLRLAYRSVLPALFPAAVVCGVLTEILEFLPLPINHSLWITAQLCGFPLGIKAVCRAYQRGLIDQKSAVALSFCSANASPSFLILYVGGRILGDLKVGINLYILQCLLSLGIALCNGALRSPKKATAKAESIIGVLGNGVSNAALGCLGLVGYICLFSALSAPMERFGWFRYLHGFLELSGGIARLESDQLLLCGAMVGFAGISVFLQNASALAKARLPIFPAFYGKILYGILVPILLILWTKNKYTIFFFLALLICFDKYRNKRYNKFIPNKRRRYL